LARLGLSAVMGMEDFDFLVMVGTVRRW
jgi:hypothetical protein